MRNLNKEESEKYIEIVKVGNFDNMADFAYELGVEETKKVLEWLVKNADEYINTLENNPQLEQDNVYTARICRQAIYQFLENPSKINGI